MVCTVMQYSASTAQGRPQGIAGGFVLVGALALLSTWRACRARPLGIGDLRTWLVCHELVARRCRAGEGRSPAYGFSELAKLLGVSEKRARASARRLVDAGLLEWSDSVIGFPEPPGQAVDLKDTIGGGRGSVAIPRRMLRHLAAGARPALIATVLGILLRCLSRGRGGFRSRGRVKASWIAQVFDLDLRRVKQARKDLVALGWITPEQADQWAENRWGRVYAIDLRWEPDGPEAGRRLPPPPAEGGRRLPPPDSHPEPLREDKDQEPAPGGPAGVEIRGPGEGLISPPTSPAAPATAPPRPPMESQPEFGSGRSARVAAGAGTSPAGVESGRPVSGRPAVIRGGSRVGPLPPPRLDDVRMEDLKDTGRLLALLDQAVARDLVGPSEADRLRFVAAAEHALAVGQGNPPGLFVYLVRGRLWRYLTGADEDRANARIKAFLRGQSLSPVATLSSRQAVRPVLSEDARAVLRVRTALARAGYRGDPFPQVRRHDSSWTRERWNAALVELGTSMTMG